MHRRDELDATLAKHFAWTFAQPGDVARLLERARMAHEGSGGLPSDVASTDVGAGHAAGAAETSRAKAQLSCRSLAVAVGSAWELTGDPERQQAVKRLLARADRLGVELLEMHRWPVDAVRLLRLFVHFGATMTRRQRERCASVAALVPLDHPEVADLLVEIAVAGDRAMADAFLSDEEWVCELGEGEGAGDVDVLAARLADVVDDGPTHASRVIAIELVGRLGATAVAVPSLRRALALPSFAVRAHALHALASARPAAVQPPELVRVLRDLVAHAVPDPFADDEHEENERIFAQAVVSALVRLRAVATSGAAPALPGQELDEAAEAFLDWIDAEHDTVWLDAGWATEALAITLPEAGAAMVDHWLKCARAYDRTKALAALDRLPDDLARPRLLVAARDPAPSVRDPALHKAAPPVRERVPCRGAEPHRRRPASRSDGDRFCLPAARPPGTGRGGARSHVARAHLAEAPERDARVLLLQFMGDDTLSAAPRALHAGAAGAGEAAPDGPRENDWAALIAAQFGAVGVEGLCALAARFSEPESFGWMRRLGDLVARGVITRDHAEPLRVLAARQVTSEDTVVADDALRLRALGGAPPELHDPVLGRALDLELGSPAARDLILAWPERTVDRRLVSAMALALAERDWPRVQCAASVALGRDAPAARVLAQRVLEVVEEDEGAIDAAIECAHRLRSSGALDDAWALAALARPDSPLFTVAARVWRRSGPVRRVLEDALASQGQRGASAAEAAMALLWGEPPMSARDRRLPTVLAAAPPIERAELVHAMCIRRAPLSSVAPHLVDLLASVEPGVARALVGIAQWLRSAKGRALLKSALPNVVDDALRADIAQELGTRTESYWVDR